MGNSFWLVQRYLVYNPYRICLIRRCVFSLAIFFFFCIASALRILKKCFLLFYVMTVLERKGYVLDVWVLVSPVRLRMAVSKFFFSSPGSVLKSKHLGLQ